MADETTDTGLDAREALRGVLSDMSNLKMPKVRSGEEITKGYEDRSKDAESYLRKKGELELATKQREASDARALAAKYEPQFQSVGDFRPSEENKAALIGLFGLIGAVGAFGGGKSYGSALSAMNAMGGMLKGYREGRKELFEREKAEFDKHMLSVKAHNDEVMKAYARAKELAKTNLGAAEVKLISDLNALGAKVQANEVREKGMVAGEEANMRAYTAASTNLKNQAQVLAQLQKSMEKAAPTEKGRAVYASIDNVEGYYSEGQLRQATAEGRSVRQVARPTDRAKTTGSDEDIESNAQSIAVYAMKAPGLNNRNRDKIMARVRQINPNYNEGTFGNQQLAERQWTTPNGAGGKQIVAYNTVYQHLNTIEQLGEALENGDTQLANRAINYLRTSLGHPEVTNFDAARQAVAAEIVKAITGVGGALADRQEAARILADYNSPEQTKGVVNTLRELIGGRYKSSEQQYISGTGRSKEDFERLLPENVRDYFTGYKSGEAKSRLKAAPQDRLEQARNALARGVSRSAVVKTLNDLGFSDEGL